MKSLWSQRCPPFISRIVPPLGSVAKGNTYPPEAHGVDESAQQVIICLQDTFHSQAPGPQPLHGTRCNLVFGLTGEHQ